MTNGWATVERVGGTDSFYAYAVVNDNVTDDGAFVAPVPVGRTTAGLTLPVAVHTSAFTTELVLTNAGTTRSAGLLSRASRRTRTRFFSRESSDSFPTCSRTSGRRVRPCRWRFP